MFLIDFLRFRRRFGLISSEDSSMIWLKFVLVKVLFQVLLFNFLIFCFICIHRFSLAWWAYTFPMTGAAIATIRYSNEVRNVITQAMSVILSAAATLTVTGLLITTILHAFVLRDLFPNDMAIAVSDQKPIPQKKWFHLRHGSSDSKDIEQYLKFAGSDGKDLEASLKHQNY